MAINTSHPIGQYCRWALLPEEALNEQITGVAPGGTAGSVITLPEGDAYVPASSATTWSTNVSTIDTFNNSITVAWYGRVDTSGASLLAQYIGSGYGWWFQSSQWSPTTINLTFSSYWQDSKFNIQIGVTSGTVHHLVVRYNKSTGKIDVFWDGILAAPDLSITIDPGAANGGTFAMQNQSASSACITCQVYEGALSNEDIASLAADPTQVFAAPPVDLDVDDFSIDMTLESPSITKAGDLFIENLTINFELEGVRVTRPQTLLIDNFEIQPLLTDVSINPYARLRNVLASVPINTWVQVNTTKYVDCVMPLADRPEGHQNSYDHVKIVIPWSSFSFDHMRGRLLLWGGGHANYTGNQLYQWHADTGEWSLSCLPSRLTQDANKYVVDGQAPQSSHTYQNNLWLERNDMFATFGGAATPAGATFVEDYNGNPRRVGPWLYDLTKTDSNKVGGSDGSGMNVSRLGLNAWQHRRDNVPTGTVGTNAYPIDYADHISQTAVAISKDGKDYVVFTMDGAASGFPAWYRYEFGNIRAGEDDQCTYLGKSSQSLIIIKEGWMVYDSKREFVYRNGYNKDSNYVQCELVIKDPWSPGLGETPIRLVKTSDGTTFTMNPVTDECPYGAAYDTWNDCIWLWGGVAPDTGTIHKISIPEYVPGTGWASTTWTVDSITPAGLRPNGLYQTPVLGKVKYVPEIGSVVVLDKASPDGVIDPGVWAFKTIALDINLDIDDFYISLELDDVPVGQDANLSIDDFSINLALGNVTTTKEANLSIDNFTIGALLADVIIAKEGAKELDIANFAINSTVNSVTVTQIKNLSVEDITVQFNIDDPEVIVFNGSGIMLQPETLTIGMTLDGVVISVIEPAGIEEQIVAILNNLIAGKAHAEVIPQSWKTFPAIRYTFPSITPVSTICGESDLDSFRIQLDIYGPEYDPLISIRKQIINAFRDNFQHAERINELTMYEDDVKMYRRMLEYSIYYDY